MEPETWYQKAYRPACGFAVAAGAFVGIIAITSITLVAVIKGDSIALSAVPGLATSMAMILGVPGAAVGIAAWHRGVQQVKQTEGDTAVQLASVPITPVSTTTTVTPSLVSSTVVQEGSK